MAHPIPGACWRGCLAMLICLVDARTDTGPGLHRNRPRKGHRCDRRASGRDGHRPRNAIGFTQEASHRLKARSRWPGCGRDVRDPRRHGSQFKPQARTVEVLVGQTVTVEFPHRPGRHVRRDGEGGRRHEPRRHAQVGGLDERHRGTDPLPAAEQRNFLNFAALAPGVRVSDNEFRKEFSAGALPSQNVNVFIDGVSFKNDVIDGGVVGQDASRGNPFPQNAVQEFQVLTQNFKAEYEKAASAIITAVTKSGGNRFSGDLFSYYQDKGLVENEAMVRDRPASSSSRARRRRNRPTSAGSGARRSAARSSRTGRSSSRSYEENRQDRAGNGARRHASRPRRPRLVQRPARVRRRVHQPVPREAAVRQTLVAAGAGQHRRGRPTAGATRRTSAASAGRAPATATRPRRTSGTASTRSRASGRSTGTDFLNEAYLSYQRYRWNPKPENPDIIGENFAGLLRIGGRDTEQLIVQQRVSLRNDYSRFLKWHGSHTAKVGGVVSFADYDVNKKFNGNPLFTYRGDISWDFPARAQLRIGQPGPQCQELPVRHLRAGRLGASATG